jgi:conjugative coupling factor TraD (TOL family)
MSTLVIDQKLRPAVEGYSAGVSFMTSAVAFTAPWALMMPPALGTVTGVLATIFGCYRARQAWQVINYRYGLKNYKITRLHPHRIASRLPKGEDSLYLGEGFSWGQEHTQRKMDAASPDAQPFLKPSWRVTPLMAPARRFETWAARTAGPIASPARALAHFTSQTAPWNLVAPREDLGGSPILHGVEPNEKPVLLRKKMRNGHMLVLGTTRVGKTRMLELLATQDIHSGAVTIIIDPKGDAELMMRVHAEAARSGRLEQLYLFHLGYPEISARYNGIGAFSRVTEVAQRATNALPSSGNSAAFKEFSWRFTNLVAQAQVALGRVPTYELILRDITNIEPLFVQYAHLVLDRYQADGKIKGWRDKLDEYEAMLEGDKRERRIAVPRSMQDRHTSVIAAYVYVKEAKLPDPVLDGLATAVAYDRSFFEKIIASLGPFLEKLTTGAVGKLLSPDYFDPNDKRPIFDWMTVIRQQGIVYVGLDALSDAVIAGAVGNSMLADLVSVGGKLYKEGTDPHHPEGRITLPHVCCHFDEVNEIAGPEFVPMVNKMGGSGFSITAYTQTIPDIEAKVGDRAKASQILGNFNHVVMLRVKSQETAKFFTDQLPRVDVITLTAVSGVTDTAADGMGRDFISNNQDRVGKTKEPALEPSDLMQLPQGQAFGLLEGNRLFKIRIPLPDASADAFIPQSLKAIGDDMRSRYRSSEQWATETDWLAQHPIGLTQPFVRGPGLDANTFDDADDADEPVHVFGLDEEAPTLVDLGRFPLGAVDGPQERAA